MRELDYGKMGMRIRQVRKAKGWSQDELAKKCGISMSFLGLIERGARIMSMETFVSICMALDAGADELLWGIANPPQAVLGMWDAAAGKADGDSDTATGKAGGDSDTATGKADGDATGKAVKTDSYSLYVRIMKSVAEIMNGA